MNNDHRIFAPATARNKEPIYRCLESRLPKAGTILEIASGSGEHTAYLSPFFPHLNWQPSNIDQDQLRSVDAWRATINADNFLQGMLLDTTETHWPVENLDYKHGPITALFNANMIHIAPWAACKGLLAGAGRILPAGGMLFLYGPFKINGRHTSDSNIQFEKWLSDQNPNFGVRDIETVTEEAQANKLELVESCSMPANNFIKIFKKQN